MKYSDIRPLIKSGDILAWSHRGWKTWHDIKIQAVRFFTQSEYSHVGTAVVWNDRVFVLEAVQPLVRLFPLSKLGEFYHLNMDAPWKPETADLGFSYIGDAYSQTQAMQAPFKEPARDHLWECAELAAILAASDGIDLGKVYTPSAVVRACKLRGSVETLVIPD